MGLHKQHPTPQQGLWPTWFATQASATAHKSHVACEQKHAAHVLCSMLRRYWCAGRLKHPARRVADVPGTIITNAHLSTTCVLGCSATPHLVNTARCWRMLPSSTPGNNRVSIGCACLLNTQSHTVNGAANACGARRATLLEAAAMRLRRKKCLERGVFTKLAGHMKAAAQVCGVQHSEQGLHACPQPTTPASVALILLQQLDGHESSCSRECAARNELWGGRMPLPHTCWLT